MTAPDPLTIRDVCQALRVAHPTVYKQIRAGRLRSYKIGRRRFVTRKALDDYIAQSERETTRSVS